MISDANGVVSGASILAAYGLVEGFNSYVGFRFDASEQFGRLNLLSTGRSFEVDNVAYSSNDVAATLPPGLRPAPAAASTVSMARARFAAVAVPEPAAAATLAAGLGLLGLCRSRKIGAARTA